MLHLLPDLDLASNDAGETKISGRLQDQTALHGVLAKIRDLGLPLIEVRRIGPESSVATASGEVDACRVVHTTIYAGIAAGIDHCHSRRHVTG